MGKTINLLLKHSHLLYFFHSLYLFQNFPVAHQNMALPKLVCETGILHTKTIHLCLVPRQGATKVNKLTDRYKDRYFKVK